MSSSSTPILVELIVLYNVYYNMYSVLVCDIYSIL